MNEMRFVVFIRRGCPFCINAENTLREKNKDFKIVDFNDDQITILKEIQDMYNWKTVPMIFRREGNDIKFIGGYSDLVEFLENNG
tara:strand:+ start:338 stop:592 length:255 start_codon:yes stop_codon:yes gene_type:complete